MAKRVAQSNQYDYTVETVPSWHQLPDGSFRQDKHFVNCRTDTWEVLGKCSERYGLMQNAGLFDRAEQAFAKRSLGEFKRNVVVTGNGARVYGVYEFKNRTATTKRGDVVGMRLTVQNSFDGILLTAFQAGYLRLACLNGMCSLINAVAMSAKHYSSINLDIIIGALDEAVSGWDESIGLFDRLTEIQITQAQGANILGNLTRQGLLSARLGEGVGSVWANPRQKEDADRNLYNLFNALTNHLTHDVAATRFELANRVNHRVLAAFNRASLDDSKFAELTADLPIEIEAVTV